MPGVHTARRLTACALLAVLGPALAEDGDAERAIRAVAERWTAAYVAGDKAGVLGVYADDAWIMPNARPHLKGHEAIGARLDALMDSPRFSIDIDIKEIQIVGDFAWAVAHYVITSLDDSGAASGAEHGTGVTIYRKDADGRWRILRDIDNERLP